MTKHIISKIIGPSHNFLAIYFADAEDSAIEVVELPAKGVCSGQALDPLTIKAHVINGVAEANSLLKIAYVIAKIEYVQDDTGPEKVYEYLAYQLVKDLECKNGGS